MEKALIIDPWKIAQKAKAKKRAIRRKRRAAKPLSSSCVVYALKDAGGRIVYVGQTRSSIEARMDYHRKSACKTGSPIQRWLCENEATIHVIDKDGIWDVSEVVWIERSRVAGEPLLNANMGGRDTGKRKLNDAITS
jgi:hypothetical protein